MASRKEQKEQARAARIAAEQDLRERAARLRRLQLFGGAILVAVAVIVVVVIVSTNGGKGHSNETSSQTKATLAVVNGELAGIPQNGVTLGKPTAKVTLTYFGDLECPICAEFTTTSTLLPQFIAQEVKTGVAKVTYRSLCTATCNDEGQSVFNTQQADAYAAGKQNHFWEYAELFYREQGAEGSGYATNAFFAKIASQIPGLDQKTWTTDTKDPSLLGQVQSDEAAAEKDGFDSTPSLVMSGPKGAESLGSGLPTSFSVLSNAVKSVS
jgi:protein-disulfide isomerase